LDPQWRDAWNVGHEDPNHVIPAYLKHIVKGYNQWNGNKKDILAPYTALINASMTGKTRLMYESLKQTYGILMVFRLPKEQHAWPPATLIAQKLILDSKVLPATLFKCIIQYFCTWKETTITPTPEKWLKEQEHPEFWLKIERMVGGTAVVDMSMEKKNELFYYHKDVGASIPFVFQIDEVVTLFNDPINISQESPFLRVRRAITELALQEFPVFLMASSTLSNLRELVPAARYASMERFPSLRYSPDKRILHPFYLVAFTDALANKVPSPPTSPHRGSSSSTSSSNSSSSSRDAQLAASSLVTLFSYGRAGLGSYMAAIATSATSRVQGLVRAMIPKLLGGRTCPWQQLSDVEQANSSIAILANRVGLRIIPSSSLASDLIANYMAICAYINHDHESLICVYPSEPALSEAAACIMWGMTTFTGGSVSIDHRRGLHDDDLKGTKAADNVGRLKSNIIHVMLNHLIRQMRVGSVDAGYRGEFVARLLAILAFDHAKLAQLQDTPSDQLSV
jgi:hypothetical protein